MRMHNKLNKKVVCLPGILGISIMLQDHSSLRAMMIVLFDLCYTHISLFLIFVRLCKMKSEFYVLHIL